MAKLVTSRIEMTYDGVKRYKGEVFALRGSPNDRKMIDVGNLHVYEGEEDDLIQDDSGRLFISEGARKAYRIKDPDGARIVVSHAPTAESGEEESKRKPGRPKGAKDSAPRKRTIDRALNTKTAADYQ